MKLYLGGGWSVDNGQFELMKKLITKVIKDAGNNSILHIPFARTGIRKVNRDAFSPHAMSLMIENEGFKYYNATYKEDIESFEGGTLYINGGNDGVFLMQQLKNLSFKQQSEDRI